MKNFVLIIATLILFISCSNPKIDYLEEFGYFINDIELRQEAIDDKAWKSVEVKYNDYSEILFMQFENDFTASELNQIDSYKERFIKIRVQRHPVDNFLDIIGF